MSFRFKPIKSDEIIIKLNQICIKENFICSNTLLEKIVSICRGDLRKAINLLQKCYNSYGDKINEDLLDELSGIMPISKFNKLLLKRYYYIVIIIIIIIIIFFD